MSVKCSNVSIAADSVSLDLTAFKGCGLEASVGKSKQSGAINKMRIDTLLTARGLAESPGKALRLLMAGEVMVEQRRVDKPGTRVPVDAEIALRQKPPFVSRGGLKLEAALNGFELDVQGIVALDVGASTGGFTDCLLQRGASKVYALDVGYGQLAWKLRQDPRVVVMDRTNIRYVKNLPELVDLAVIDASFISLELVLPAVIRLLKPDAQVVALVKPQFEAGRKQVGKGGVIRDPAIHRQVLLRVCGLAKVRGLVIMGMMPSPLRGPAGNVEFLVRMSTEVGAVGVRDTEGVIEACLVAVPGELGALKEESS